MPFLRLRSQLTDEMLEFEHDLVRIGRDPACELVASGQGSEVVSGTHTRLAYRDGRWWVEDLGSRNGTFLDDVRLAPSVPKMLAVGSVVRLGGRGPRFLVEATQSRQVEETLVEDPELTLPLDREEARALGLRSTPPAEPPPPPPPPKEPPPKVAPREEAPPGPAAAEPPAEVAPAEPGKPTATVIFMEQRTGESFRAAAGRIRIGRGKECELRPIGPDDTSVSRVHSEVVLRPDGRVVARDAQSRNGTFVNGERVTGDKALKAGDHVRLGPTGPDLVVIEILLPKKEAPKPKPGAPSKHDSGAKKKKKRKPESAAARAAEKLGTSRRSFGGMGATIFFNEMFTESSRKSARRLRIAVWSFVAVIAVVVGVAYWYKGRLEQQLQAQLAAQQAVADSVRQAASQEYRRLQRELDEARAGSAPRAVVESLQVALSEAQDRTTALEVALRRAEASVSAQLAAGDSIRRVAQAELGSLQRELERARAAGTSAGLLDSLRAAVRDAEQRAADIATRVDAVRSGNLASVAQANQGAVGLVTAHIGGEMYDGSGFAVTASGYFVTNRHVIRPTGKPQADSVFVTLADQRTMRRAVIVGLVESPGPDLALLRIVDHDGSHVTRIDWEGDGARQGEPAALIGFPAGFGNALDQTGVVRTSMTAGIFAKVTADDVNFDGFTVGGSSGSPIFNANGEVVAVHRAGLREAVGMGFAVPIAKLVRLIPESLKPELGLR